jgi:hypothetical protein
MALHGNLIICEQPYAPRPRRVMSRLTWFPRGRDVGKRETDPRKSIRLAGQPQFAAVSLKLPHRETPSPRAPFSIPHATRKLTIARQSSRQA